MNDIDIDRLPGEAQQETGVVLGKSEQSTLAVGTCLAEIAQQAEGFIAHIKSKFHGLDAAPAWSQMCILARIP